MSKITTVPAGTRKTKPCRRRHTAPIACACRAAGVFMGVESLFGQLSGQHYIGGELRAARGDRHAAIIDPATEQVIGRYTDATVAEVDEAVRVANAAQKRWHKVNYHR